MSRLLYISMCIFRCFIHSHCHHCMLSNIWFNKCVMVLHGRMSRRIPKLCRTHEGMRYQVEPIHVVQRTLARCYTYLTYYCNVFGKPNPSIINAFYTERRSNMVLRNGLHIPKLSYNLLQSMYDNRRTTFDMFGK